MRFDVVSPLLFILTQQASKCSKHKKLVCESSTLSFRSLNVYTQQKLIICMKVCILDPLMLNQLFRFSHVVACSEQQHGDH